MAPSRFGVLFLSLLLASSVHAARNRAVSHPGPESASDWLNKHAIVLASTESTGNVDDLAPLASIIGNAHVVGLGDATHGTHELFTMKVRLMQFLVERMGFDTLAVEASFPQLQRVNAYVQGGSGDPKQLLAPRTGEQPYWFWQTDEFVAVVEWMRNYNLSRGTKPAVTLFGADMYDGKITANMVLDYLNAVDKDQVQTASVAYRCVFNGFDPVCQGSGTQQQINAAKAVTAQMEAKENDYTARSSHQAFLDAVQASRVAAESLQGFGFFRDVAMGDNVTWAKDHLSNAKKVIFWAHNEHVTRGPSAYGVITNLPAGEMLRLTLGSDYFSIGSATWGGHFLTRPLGDPSSFIRPSMTPAGADYYETFFHASRNPNIIVPLRDLHPFLAAPHHMRESGSGEFSSTSPNADIVVDLARRFDAVLFIDQGTPTSPTP